jgi:hypothetical protein
MAFVPQNHLASLPPMGYQGANMPQYFQHPIFQFLPVLRFNPEKPLVGQVLKRVLWGGLQGASLTWAAFVHQWEPPL